MSTSILQKYAHFWTSSLQPEAIFKENDWDCRILIGPIFWESYLGHTLDIQCVYIYICGNYARIFRQCLGSKPSTPRVRSQKMANFRDKISCTEIGFLVLSHARKRHWPRWERRNHMKTPPEPYFYRALGQSPPSTSPKTLGMSIMLNPPCQQKDSGRGNLNNVNNVNSKWGLLGQNRNWFNIINIIDISPARIIFWSAQGKC